MHKLPFHARGALVWPSWLVISTGMEWISTGISDCEEHFGAP